MITQTQETYERRIATLRRLGAKIVEITCEACKERFVDPEPLGGRTWKLAIADDSRRPGEGRYARRRFFCSELCVKKAFDKHRGGAPAWIEGYEPPDQRSR